jgi:microcystin-dependent protein
MSTPFIAEVKIVSFGFAPKGWAQCDGQLLPINQNQALFSLLGTTYGGDGRVNFALPDLRERLPLHMGAGFTMGQKAGENAHTLIVPEIPIHTHTPVGNSAQDTLTSLSGNRWGADGSNPFGSTAPNNNLAPASILPTGGSQAHSNQSPFLALNFVIALQGIFPSQN